MKLLQATGRYYLLFSLFLFVLGGGILYLALSYFIDIETDERLLDTKPALQFQLSAMDSLPSVLVISDDVIETTPLPEFTEYEHFSDTLVWDPIEKEFEPYRKFTYHDKIHGGPYRIALSHTKLDSEALVMTSLFAVLGILLFLLLAINLFNRYLSLRLWRPFYQTIEQIRGFAFDKGAPLSPPRTRIEEFEVLNRALELMTTKVLSDYRSLKQFTENASHEIQTPLAIIRSKIELLMQQGGRNENERQAIQYIQEAASRLSKLNTSLLLLARIENRQYSDTRELNFKTLIEKKIDQLEPLISSKNLTVQAQLADVSQKMDPTLAEVLLSNLLINAIKHNLPGGNIEARLQEKKLSIRNTGKPLTGPSEDLFKRFRKGTDASPSLGLGLAIVKEICAIYGFEAKYAYQDNWHELTISWKN
ncbi:MAG: HAMP domain-containing histidine kinase [Lewinellaceae bacterium]|nr:HAMP domain-containing histidine kinase [Phaeodactylibacter sp.]MCB0611702.1 HAMP domain-containing histidine kinase [Phaeodactylibacter sp.]MCB9348232.1 HAMP domain-containing histidine kinase [Lewinellaceae bacterium]